jgi:hypothetical protein
MFYHLVNVGSFVNNKIYFHDLTKFEIMLRINKNINLKANNLKRQIILAADFQNQVGSQRVNAGQVGGFIGNLKPA